MVALGKTGRKEMGQKGRQHVLNNYNYETFCEKWVATVDDIVENNGSWNTREGYGNIRFKEVA